MKKKRISGEAYDVNKKTIYTAPTQRRVLSSRHSNTTTLQHTPERLFTLRPKNCSVVVNTFWAATTASQLSWVQRRRCEPTLTPRCTQLQHLYIVASWTFRNRPPRWRTDRQATRLRDPLRAITAPHFVEMSLVMAEISEHLTHLSTSTVSCSHFTSGNPEKSKPNPTKSQMKLPTNRALCLRRQTTLNQRLLADDVRQHYRASLFYGTPCIFWWSRSDLRAELTAVQLVNSAHHQCVSVTAIRPQHHMQTAPRRMYTQAASRGGSGGAWHTQQANRRYRLLTSTPPLPILRLRDEHTHSRVTALFPGLPRWAATRR